MCGQRSRSAPHPSLRPSHGARWVTQLKLLLLEALTETSWAMKCMWLTCKQPLFSQAVSSSILVWDRCATASPKTPCITLEAWTPTESTTKWLSLTQSANGKRLITTTPWYSTQPDWNWRMPLESTSTETQENRQKKGRKWRKSFNAERIIYMI